MPASSLLEFFRTFAEAANGDSNSGGLSVTWEGGGLNGAPDQWNTATVAITHAFTAGGGGGRVAAGITEYQTYDPNTGVVDTEHFSQLSRT